jgi:hypothetical protein
MRPARFITSQMISPSFEGQLRGQLAHSPGLAVGPTLFASAPDRLKGGSNTAQGNALGVAIQKYTVALKGPGKRIRLLFDPSISPLQGDIRLRRGRIPGRCPGLSYFGLSGRTLIK